VALLVLGLLASTAARANLLTNGSFETTTAGSTSGDPSEVTNSNLTSWQVSGAGGTPYFFVMTNQAAFITANGAAGYYNGYSSPNPGAITTFTYNPGLSPDGGNYIGANTQDDVGTLTQSVGGLTPGAAYALSFYQATTSETAYGTNGFTGRWEVTFGSQTTNSAGMVTPAYSSGSGGGTGWVFDTLVFTASSATQALSFVANSTSGDPPLVLLDGVSLTQIPEPATLALTGAGVLGLFGVRARRRRAARSARAARPE